MRAGLRGWSKSPLLEWRDTMASSDNQGLQIALIVFVILTLILSVTTFLFYQQWSESADMASKERTEKGTKEAALREATQENTRLKEMIGLAPTAAIAESEETFKKDMEAYGTSLPAEKLHYRDVLSAVADSLNNTSVQLAEQQAVAQELKDKHLTREEVKLAQIQEHEKAFKDAAERLELATSEYRSDRERLTGDRDSINDRFRKLETDLNNARDEFNSEKKRMSDDRQLAQARANEAAKKLKDATQQTFDVADGQIVKVNMKSRTVWIDLGRADDLRPQVTFSVFGPSDNDVARTERKGSIEVTNILDNHLAEARIMEDKLSNPFATGDKIFTPAWHPGRKERFALTGLIDLDGDLESDRELLRELISIAGGEIDAEIDDKGDQVGKLTFNTRYLITGEEPRDEIAAKKQAAIISEAESLGVERITVDKFLDHVGYKDPQRLLRFDRKARPKDFRAPRPDGGYPNSSGVVSETFRKRTPTTTRPKPLDAPRTQGSEATPAPVESDELP
jgi:hypothetical protein